MNVLNSNQSAHTALATVLHRCLILFKSQNSLIALLGIFFPLVFLILHIEIVIIIFSGIYYMFFLFSFEGRGPTKVIICRIWMKVFNFINLNYKPLKIKLPPNQHIPVYLANPAEFPASELTVLRLKSAGIQQLEH